MILLLGYGDVAQRVATQLMTQSPAHQVVGVCRNPQQKSAPAGVTLVAGDASNEQDLRTLISHWQPTTIVITLTPTRPSHNTGDDDSQEAYRQGYLVPCRHLQKVLAERATAPQIIYVSSTGVYGQREGEWVDEHSETLPTSVSGELLLQAEQTLRSCHAAVSILRCSGIYGPGRDYLIRQLKQGKAVATPAWSNRIHVDDVAGFICFLIDHPEQAQSTFVVSDSQPTQQREVYQWLATQLGVSTAAIKTTEQVGSRGSKRCNSALLQASGYRLRYPTYQQGYLSLLS